MTTENANEQTTNNPYNLPPNVNKSNLRLMLKDSFGADEFLRHLGEHTDKELQAIAKNLNSAMEFDQMLDLSVPYAERHGLLELLIDLVKVQNKHQWGRWQNKIYYGEIHKQQSDTVSEKLSFREKPNTDFSATHARSSEDKLVPITPPEVRMQIEQLISYANPLFLAEDLTQAEAIPKIRDELDKIEKKLESHRLKSRDLSNLLQLVQGTSSIMNQLLMHIDQWLSVMLKTDHFDDRHAGYLGRLAVKVEEYRNNCINNYKCLREQCGQQLNSTAITEECREKVVEALKAVVQDMTEILECLNEARNDLSEGVKAYILLLNAYSKKVKGEKQ